MASSHPLLPRLGSVPQDPDEAQALFQRRLAVLTGFSGSLYGLVWILNAAINAAFYPEFAAGKPWSLRSAVHGGAALVMFATFVALRLRRGIAVRALLGVDAIATALVGVALGGMVALGEAARRPDMVAFQVLTQYLVLRAALVPSTARRTLLLGVLASLPLFGGVWHLYSGPARPAMVPSPIGGLITALLWCAMSVATTGMVSSVIYGLSERVRAAMKLGQYTLEEKLGEGGMGIVYRARHALLRRPTAVKLLLKRHGNEEALARFTREVQLTASLSHPNIVSIYDFGRSADGRFYYAMEYLDGVDLERVVRRDGPQPPARVRALLEQAAEGLAEAHDAEIGRAHV